MTSTTLMCTRCDYTARRRLRNTAGCRGVHETRSELALCPKGHGSLVRKDGVSQEIFSVRESKEKR